MEIDEPDDLFVARHFGDQGPVPTTPLGAAVLWTTALTEPATFEALLQRLTVDTSWWGDFSEAESILSKLSMTSNPVVDPDEPTQVAHIKFIDYSGDKNARAIDAALLDDVWLLTLRRLHDSPDRWWQVWGLSHNNHPPASDILDDEKRVEGTE